MDNKTVICYGEVLWDLLPSGKRPGGAPMNVAYHLNNLGIPTRMISRVGKDVLGEEISKFLMDKKVPLELIQKDPDFPTGIVKVELDEQGHAAYEIVQPVAWDRIECTEAAMEAVKKADVFVFGSLAARSEKSASTLLRLLEEASLRVFDVNLRTPFYSRELLEELFFHADIVKMNEDELREITAWYTALATDRERMQFLLDKYRLKGLVLTLGKDGAAFLDGTGFYSQPGFPVKVKDTVGSGDSFLAAFLSKLLQEEAIPECLRFGCATGALVATKEGGTPEVGREEILLIAGSGD